MRGRDAHQGVPPALFVLVALLAAPLSAQETAGPAEGLVARAREARLAEDPAWLALGHYRRSRGGLQSEADGPGFFLSPQGKTDPAAELEATLRAFQEPAPGGAREQAAACRFPARWAWLKERLAFDARALPAPSCPRYEEWRASMDPESVTLVFATAYLNNPGSMYGHTFLRLRRRGSAAGEELLDYTLNFAGNPDTRDPFLYTVKGIFGAFPGNYSTFPYYMKVQEYTDLESRDLWEYDLALSSGAVDRLVRHAWEMGTTWFDYYFFSENCSYQLLTLLDAAEPSLRLAGGSRPWVIPADTVRAVLARPGLVKASRWRPSHMAQLRARRARLSRAERRLAARLGEAGGEKEEAALAGLPPERAAFVIDSALDHLGLRAGWGPEKPPAAAATERALSLARGRLGLGPLSPDLPVPAPLEAGHRTARLGVGFGADRNGPFQELSFRGALHDLVAPGEGYSANSQLEMGDIRLRYSDRDREPFIERLDVLSIVSLAPWDAWHNKPSWKISTGVDQARELGCSGASCMYYGLNVGSGLAAETRLLDREVYFVMAEADLGVGPVFGADWRAGAGGGAGVLLRAGSFWRALVEATWIHYQQGPDRQRLRLVSSFRLSRDLELRAVLDRRVPDREASGSLLWHF